MGHDEGTHQTSGYAPRSGPNIIELVVLVDKLNIECLGEVLAEEVGCTALQGLSVLHQTFDGIGVEGTGKTFVGALHTLHHGHGHVVFSEIGIHAEHLTGFGFGFIAGSVSGVAFLPQELGGAEKEAGTHFPTHYIGPLVAQDGQVAIGIDPVLIGTPDDGFGSRTDDEFFFQTGGRVHRYTRAIGGILQAIVGYHSTFLGKTFNVFGFAAEV